MYTHLPEAAPNTAHDSKEPTLTEMKEEVKKATADSAPEPKSIPYKVNKMWPKLLLRLLRLLKVMWRKGKTTDCWQKAKGLFILKEKNSV